MKNRRKQNSRINCEQLETRIMPAGAVTASIFNKVLTIKGDSSGNVISVFQTSRIDKYSVTGSSTKINGATGGAFNFTLQQVDVINIDMGDGNDSVFVFGTEAPGVNKDLDAPKGMTISTGAGNDTVFLKFLDVHQNSLTVSLGSGNDSLIVTSIRVQTGSLNVRPSTGFDAVEMSGVAAGTDISVVSSIDASVRVSIQNSTAGNIVDVDLSEGVDIVNIVNVKGKKLTAKLFDGNDKLNVKSSQFSSGATLNGGDGDDLLNFFSNVGDSSWVRTAFRSPTRSNLFFT